jgi:hypothetical protein
MNSQTLPQFYFLSVSYDGIVLFLLFLLIKLFFLKEKFARKVWLPVAPECSTPSQQSISNLATES